MALFNKLFSTTRKKIDTKCEDNLNNICSKLFTFSKEQVRVVLYRECDFRGRKLLFDSSSVERISLTQHEGLRERNDEKKYAEITDTFGYVYLKPKTDVNQLGEIIFGSVAMSFRGTTYKIHSFNESATLMCTQVFPGPRKNYGRRSLPMQSYTHSSTTSSSLEQSTQFDDSGTSSITSLSEHLSVSSTASDTWLVCRKNRSVPLDVPNFSYNIPKLTIDSGYSCEQLCSSFSSGPPSFPTLDPSQTGSKSAFSCGSLYKRWLRSTNNSLEHSCGSLNGGSNSGDELFTKHNNKRASKLGLAVIIKLTVGEEEYLEKFLMEHAALIESMVWRARQGTEMAYLRPSNFLSVMLEVYDHISEWLVDFLSGPYLSGNMWLTLNCDNNSSIKFSESMFNNRTLMNFNCDVTYKSNGSNAEANVDFPLLILTRLFKNENECHKKFHALNKNLTAEIFVKDLCELLETIDVKHTNFFMSTLITAVLTHHLGWVTTVMPSINGDKEKNCPGNPLWGQLIDLYGATGYPTKVCHTIVTGCDKSDLIPKILNILTYFIRCNNITRSIVQRDEKEEENVLAEKICLKNMCIPEENFKKYEDHVRQITEESTNFLNHKKTSNTSLVSKSFGGLKKSNTFLQDLSDVDTTKDGKLFDKVAHIGFESDNSLSKSKINENIHRLCRIPTDTILKHVSNSEKGNLVDIKEASDEIKRVFSHKDSIDKDDDDKVLFLLGENEKLIGLSKEKNCDKKEFLESKTKFELGYDDDDLKTFEDEFKTSLFKDSDFVWNNGGFPIKPSTSCMFLNLDVEKPCGKNYGRSQSVPREQKLEGSNKSNVKYRYSGVKFNFQQHPQIFTNYMKSKNIELSSLAFSDKEIDSEKLLANFDYFNTEPDFEDVETLETPSNATELEFSNELTEEIAASEKKVANAEFNANKSNTSDILMVQFPMPKFSETRVDLMMGYTSSLMRGLNNHYMSDMVLQGISSPKSKWETSLKKDLVLSTRHPFLDQQVEEAVAIIANKDTWEVLLMSSHKYVVDKGNPTGVRVGMSQLVANMLETLLHMWKLHTPPEYCLMHIEHKLQEFFFRSKALAQLLLATEFCSMELLTSTLQLEINDVPLIMAIASTHTPQIMQKYGLSFQ